MSDFYPKTLLNCSQASGTVQCHPQWSSLLKQTGLNDFLDFLHVPATPAFRDVLGRLTVSLQLADGRTAYLKRHWGEFKSGHPPAKEAEQEWTNTRFLEEQGIPVPTPLAWGQGIAEGVKTAFYLSLEVPGTQGDHFVKEHFTPQRDEAKLLFIDKLAAVAADFHRKGFNHRDFYLCHFFIDRKEDDFIYHLIDLQRVQHRRHFRRRWIVKDLSQTCYSCPPALTSTDKMRFFLRYLGQSTLQKKDKKLARAILSKVKKLQEKEKRTGIGA